MSEHDKAGRATDQNIDSTEGVRSVKKCTKMQKQFVRNHVRTGEVYKSATDAGFKHGSYGSTLLKEPHIQTAIQQEMLRQGISETLLSKKMKEGLGANYPAKFSAKTGNLLQKEAPDFFTRKQYIDMILKIRGDYAPERHQVESKQIVILLDHGLIKGLKDSGAISDVEADVLEAEIIEE